MAHGRLQALDMSADVEKTHYAERLETLQTRFRALQQAYLKTGDSAIVVFEGWDAAGKGGTIRRISSVMDPRGFRVWPIGAPSAEDARRHYLARFWDRLPTKGEIVVFDRSWYGRVLVERVEKLAKRSEWERAYDEITAFEKMQTDSGVRIIKIFLYITAEEQLRRFEKRMSDPLKRWKLSYEDFRNRERWDDYVEAAEEMLKRTDHKNAPWIVLPANNKRFARIEALTAIERCLSEGVDLSPAPVSEELMARYRQMVGGD